MRYGPEVEKCMPRWKQDGFLRYLRGKGVDIGWRGDRPDAEPIADAVGVDLETPGYDGIHLPMPDESLDYVFSSHMFEHVPTTDYREVIRDWYRVLKFGGFIVCVVPHMFLYEKKWSLPSRYNGDHKQFFTPSFLLELFEMTLQPNSYRLRLLHDCDLGYDYSIPPEQHAGGEYQIEMVLQKIKQPDWDLAQ